MKIEEKYARLKFFFNFLSEIYQVRSFVRTLNFAETIGITYTHIYCNASFCM